ncbi:hypothetical protein PHISCL_03625 [Aspergillus sclerotialis]|uniref:Uncharacterized protein n=1 Tax=Aspergillus sclerotialis TaxID=2070753 RepID=A0A3A3A3V1_9EURO|nr:hypothetical protein PHISCL_03625 [Aspergillus sclerotialis]
MEAPAQVQAQVQAQAQARSGTAHQSTDLALEHFNSSGSTTAMHRSYSATQITPNPLTHLPIRPDGQPRKKHLNLVSSIPLQPGRLRSFTACGVSPLARIQN